MAIPKEEPIEAVPTRYSGTWFRLTLEADWAHTLDELGIEWEYEPYSYKMPSGEHYTPDFWLPRVRTFIEVKGAHMARAHKPAELAELAYSEDIIVLLGFAPVTRLVGDYLRSRSLQWRDPLGYDTRIAKCQGCGGYQWMRAEISRDCRLCGTGHRGLLAKPGEMPFHVATPDRPFWMVAR